MNPTLAYSSQVVYVVEVCRSDSSLAGVELHLILPAFDVLRIPRMPDRGCWGPVAAFQPCAKETQALNPSAFTC